MSADKTTSVLIESTSISSGKEIGRGAYGRVFEVDYEGTACAAKEIHSALLEYAYGDQIQNLKDNFLHEWQIWSTLRHPNVVQFLGMLLRRAHYAHHVSCRPTLPPRETLTF